MRRHVLTFIVLLAGMVQVACQNNDKDSILLIAVDDLVVADLNCGQPNGTAENFDSKIESKAGLDLLCRESVRFTHAFSPSTLSVPALASILTGQYPVQHGMRNNGQSLDMKKVTAAEAAIQRGYRTAFFSGGAPVLRKTGLNQGFEVFDDNIVPNFNALFRPLKKSVSLFDQWLRQDVGSSPFLTLIYAPDLIFTNTQTLSEIGEPRNFSYESQLDELNENLYLLFQNLKRQNRWDRTTIILAGLNGHTSSDRPNEATGLNLHSENNQIALLIKPSQKKRDEGINWKVDKNVSLTDLGKTLFELLKMPLTNPEFIIGGRPTEGATDLPVDSLAGLLLHPETELPEDRPLLLESGWGAWKGLSNIRSAVVRNHALYINDENLSIYNTLVDRFETNPLSPNDRGAMLPQSVQDILLRNGFTPWTGITASTRAKISLGYARWMKPEQSSALLRDLKSLIKRYPRDSELERWLAEVALEMRDWPTLRQAGLRTENDLWTYTAEKNLGLVKRHLNEPCLALLREKRLQVGRLKTCNDPLMLDLVDWLRADARGLSREAQRKKFERAYRIHRIDLHIRRSNIGVGQIWDLSREVSYAPAPTDLVLNLPEYQRLRSQLEKAIRLNETVED